MHVLNTLCLCVLFCIQAADGRDLVLKFCSKAFEQTQYALVLRGAQCMYLIVLSNLFV